MKDAHATPEGDETLKTETMVRSAMTRVVAGNAQVGVLQPAEVAKLEGLLQKSSLSSKDMDKARDALSALMTREQSTVSSASTTLDFEALANTPIANRKIYDQVTTAARDRGVDLSALDPKQVNTFVSDVEGLRRAIVTHDVERQDAKERRTERLHDLILLPLRPIASVIEGLRYLFSNR